MDKNQKDTFYRSGDKKNDKYYSFRKKNFSRDNSLNKERSNYRNSNGNRSNNYQKKNNYSKPKHEQKLIDITDEQTYNLLNNPNLDWYGLKNPLPVNL